MKESSARAIVLWRYESPYDVYNHELGEIEESLQVYLDPKHHYYCMIVREHGLVGFCCFGSDAQVPGGDYSTSALDIGMGIRPDLTGQRNGSDYAKAVLEFAQRTFAPEIFRVTIAQFNKRAQRVWENAGFKLTQEFQKQKSNNNFVIMMKYR